MRILHTDANGNIIPPEYTTRADAIAHEIIPALEPYADDFDIDAIADEVLNTVGEGTTQFRYLLKSEYLDAPDEFWSVAQEHEKK